MRAFAFATALSIALAGNGEAATQRAASLNLCTDELLLALAKPEQIASLSHLAATKAESPYWQTAARYRLNDGSLLSVAALRVDLVLTMGGGIRDKSWIARRLGIRTLTLPYPNSLSDVERSIRIVAAALGRDFVGERLVARIEGLKRTAPAAATDAVWLSGGGRSIAPSGLGAEWMRLAGFKQRALAGDRISLEQLLLSPPKLILRSDYRSGEYSGQQRWLSHPLARRATGAVMVPSDGRRWTCMGPSLVEEIERLRRVPR